MGDLGSRKLISTFLNIWSMSASDAEADQIQMPQYRDPKLVEHGISQFIEHFTGIEQCPLSRSRNKDTEVPSGIMFIKP